jgi:hypothetical protein
LSSLGLAVLEHAQGDAGLQTEVLDGADHLGHLGEILVFRATPGSAHAEARGALVLGRLRCGDHFVERQQGFALGFGAVARGLRAIAAILRTAAGLDGEQRRALNLVGVEVLAVHLLRAKHQIHQGSW